MACKATHPEEATAVAGDDTGGGTGSASVAVEGADTVLGASWRARRVSERKCMLENSGGNLELSGLIKPTQVLRKPPDFERKKSRKNLLYGKDQALVPPIAMRGTSGRDGGVG